MKQRETNRKNLVFIYLLIHSFMRPYNVEFDPIYICTDIIKLFFVGF